MEDVIDLGPIFEGIKGQIPDGTTHVLFRLRSRNSAALFTFPYGMYVAEAASKTAIIGENPNKRESRLFLHHELAVDCVRRVAITETPDASVFEHDVESGRLIALPDGEESLIVNGPKNLRGIGSRHN